ESGNFSTPFREQKELIMKVWILQLMAVLLWVALHHHLMANAHDIYPHPEPKPIIEQNNTDEDWKVNFTQQNVSEIPLVIFWLDDLCLEAHISDLNLVTCNESVLEQRWLFFDDYTIRPATQPSKCLIAEPQVGGIIFIDPCITVLPERKVWHYRHTDKAIVNVASGLVMDVSFVRDDVSQIFTLNFNFGTPSQKWYTEPVPLPPPPPPPSPPPPLPAFYALSISTSVTCKIQRGKTRKKLSLACTQEEETIHQYAQATQSSLIQTRYIVHPCHKDFLFFPHQNTSPLLPKIPPAQITLLSLTPATVFSITKTPASSMRKQLSPLSSRPGFGYTRNSPLRNS
ncbi:unnamed protein product, partial [Dovyalis caffra]